MTRLEVYRSGPATDSDTSQYITFKNVTLHKYLDNSSIKTNINKLSQANYLDFSNVGITDGMVGYWPLNGNAEDYSGNNATINTVNNVT